MEQAEAGGGDSLRTAERSPAWTVPGLATGGGGGGGSVLLAQEISVLTAQPEMPLRPPALLHGGRPPLAAPPAARSVPVASQWGGGGGGDGRQPQPGEAPQFQWRPPVAPAADPDPAGPPTFAGAVAVNPAGTAAAHGEQRWLADQRRIEDEERRLAGLQHAGRDEERRKLAEEQEMEEAERRLAQRAQEAQERRRAETAVHAREKAAEATATADA